MSAPLTIASSAVRSWVALYTLGLPTDLREERRREIDCDLWEQRQLDQCQGERPLGTAAEIAARSLLGMLSDITWRVQAGLFARSKRSIKVNETLTTRGLFVVALTIAVLPIAWGISRMAGVGGAGVLYGMGVLVAGAVLAAGLAMSSRRPQLGLGLVALGGLAVSLLWFWMFFIVIPVLLVLAFVAYSRARRTGWRWPRGTGAA